jgi:dUTP pyrophosphatase
MKIKFKKLHPDAQLPTKSEGNIGWDLFVAHCSDPFNSNDHPHNLKVIPPGERRVFATGLSYEPEPGYSIVFRDRSGNAVKKGLHVLAGTIDESYRGELLVCVLNTSESQIEIRTGDRICQFVVEKEIPTEIGWADELGETDRGDKGFGSSGR